MTEVPTPPRPLARSSEGRILTGVCAGLGRYTGIDPIVFRAGFALLLLGSGVGVYLYLAAFLLMRAPTGGPGYVEQWTRRDFSGDTVLALLTAVLGFGLMINLATVAFGMGTLVVAILLAVGLLAAHSNGVDLLGLARSMPERLNRR
ncbi:MAG: PspC domain-containing protein, partial [Thermoactinospora sp.]|nr:PspC domain-containing protein [Thermoactinospora sp.]